VAGLHRRPDGSPESLAFRPVASAARTWDVRRITVLNGRMRAMKVPTAIIAALAVLATVPATAAAAGGATIKVSPKRIDFGMKAVTDPATDYYDGVKVTNASGATLDVLEQRTDVERLVEVVGKQLEAENLLPDQLL